MTVPKRQGAMARPPGVARSLSVVLGLALAATSACQTGSSDEKACTEIGCLDGLSVSFVHEAWKQGRYRFEIDLDDMSVVCRTELPLAVNTEGSCSDERVLLELSGAALPADQHAITGLTVMGGLHPRAVSIMVIFDHEEVGTVSLSPEYARVAPNGEECGPVCLQANATFAF